MSKKNGFSKADLNTLLETDEDPNDLGIVKDDHITKARVVRKSQEGIDPLTTHKKSSKHKDKKRYADEMYGYDKD